MTNKGFVNKSELKKLFSNFFSLSVLQIVSYILPLFTLPYLVGVLGSEHFGILAFASSTVAFFKITTDYGFNLSATKQVSIYRNDINKLSEIFNSVMFIKLSLTLICFILLFLLLISFDKFSTNRLIYLYTYGTVIGHTLFPVWFFQGLEKMKFITVLNSLSKLIFTILIFVFVKSKEDFLLVPILNSIGLVFSGVVSIIIIFKKFQIKLYVVTLKKILFYLKDGWYIFISNLANGFYTNSTIFILGFFTNNNIVGYYSAGERLIKIIQNLMSPIFQVLYPFIAKKREESEKSVFKLLKNILFFLSCLMLVLGFVLLFKSEFIVIKFFGTEFSRSIVTIQILAFLPLTYVCTNILGIQMMLNFGLQKDYGKVFIISIIINVLLSIILIPLYKDIGTAITTFITELLFVLLMYYYLGKNGYKIFSKNAE